MMKSLYSLVREYRSLSIVGMCKNAGKTTALNSVIQDFSVTGETLALTSIGRDGEEIDVVTGTKKPGIYIREGSLIATAEGLLRSCDITKEILSVTNITTPLGEVVVARALSDGNVQLAGPSMVGQLVGISRLFQELGASRIVIDGAAGRKTLCSRSLAEATVLCVGASYGRSIDAVVAEAAHTCRLLLTPEARDTTLEKELTELAGKYLLLGEGPLVLLDGADLAVELKHLEKPRLLYVDGAVTDSLVDSLLRGGLPEGFTVVARDASRFLLSPDSMRRLSARNGRLKVLEGIHLAAVTVNPYSAYGYCFDGPEFLSRMEAAVPVPVINVEAGGGDGND